MSLNAGQKWYIQDANSRVQAIRKPSVILLSNLLIIVSFNQHPSRNKRLMVFFDSLSKKQYHSLAYLLLNSGTKSA